MAGKEKTTLLLIDILREREQSLNEGSLFVYLSLNKITADSIGFAPLHHAVVMRMEAVVRYLLQCGANPNHMDIQNETPLFIAVKNSDSAIVNTLLTFGALPTIRNNQQHTVIQFA